MTYKLKSLEFTTSHWPAKATLLRDGSKNTGKKPELDAQAASGDYFATLATRLDQISQSLQDSQHSDFVIVENLIRDLLYLQANYTIVKK